MLLLNWPTSHRLEDFLFKKKEKKIVFSFFLYNCYIYI